MMTTNTAQTRTRMSAPQGERNQARPNSNWLVALGGQRIRTLFDATATASTMGRA